jgi:IS1 family transposase
MNRLSTSKRAQIIGMLCEGMSMRATARLSGASIITVMKLLVDMGRAADEYQDAALRNLRCRRIQLDEIWAFCYAKAKNVPEHMRGRPGLGDLWTWTAICADSKLVLSWRTGTRGKEDAGPFLADLASRLAVRPQITSDGHSAYLQAVEAAFGRDVDYAQLLKVYGLSPEGERRYSPAVCLGAYPDPITGNPDPAHVSTSFVERQNLNIRMHKRRFTRLTNAFSKKAENHAHAFALQTLHHNFARVHTTLRVTPAMEAGIADHVWTLEEMAGLLNGRAQRARAA